MHNCGDSHVPMQKLQQSSMGSECIVHELKVDPVSISVVRSGIPHKRAEPAAYRMPLHLLWMGEDRESIHVVLGGCIWILGTRPTFSSTHLQMHTGVKRIRM